MNEQLKKTLDDLHTQLNKLDQLGEEDRLELQSAAKEIQESLEKTDVSSATLARLFHDMTAKFSKDHPKLTQTAGQIADMLSQMGI